MPRLPNGELSHHPTKGYRVSVGTYLKDGKPTPKVFWLGHDPEFARFKSHFYRKAWEQPDRLGQHWTPEAIRAVNDFIATGTSLMRSVFTRHEEKARIMAPLRGIAFPSAVTAKTSASAPEPNSEPAKATLYAAISAFLGAFKAKRRADSHKERADRVLNINLKSARQDCALSAIDYIWIDRLCDYFKARPASLKDGKPISPTTVSIILRYIRMFFVWLDDTNYAGWQGPRKLTKPFRCNIQDLMTSAELRVTGVIKQFDIATLKKLYSAASDCQRTIMLMALFTGATQQELAVMEKSEFDLAAGMIRHFRNKTKVEGRYWLPPELVKLLRKTFAKLPGDALAFRTNDGNALVTFKDGRQTSDAVRQMWDDLRDSADLPDALSFKYLRKFLADWMTRNGGEDFGQIALSHKRQTVLAKNYTTAQDFEGFNELQRQMHRELKMAKMFQPATKQKIKDAKRDRLAA